MNYRSPRQEPYDASDPTQVDAAEAAARQRDEQERDVERRLMATEEGRRWVWRVLAACHVLQPVVVLDAAGYAQGREDGRRDVGLDVLRRACRASPRDFALMVSENDDV